MEEQKKIDIPEVVYQGDDKKLKERVSRFKTGSFRIAVFTVVGFIMGAYSRTYTSIGFFPVKLILAVPYKISEAVYVSVIGTDAAQLQIVPFGSMGWHWFLTEFFPHSLVATFLAETVTTVLMGGAIYGALAYFTGDKRVFTMQRFVRFAAVWCAVILVSIGMAYLVNAKAVRDNENLRGTPQFMVFNSRGSGSRLEGQLVTEYFYSGLEEGNIARDNEEELPLEILFNDTRVCACRVNHEKQYVATEQGRTYHISAEFAQIIRQYEEEGVFPPDIYDGEAAEGVEASVEAIGGIAQ